MHDFILETLASITSPWVLFGLLAQAIFFLRFVVQLIASEKAKKTVIPVSFWYLSVVGAVMLFFYSVKQQDLVFILGQGLALIIYVRNLVIHYKSVRPNATERATDK